MTPKQPKQPSKPKPEQVFAATATTTTASVVPTEADNTILIRTALTKVLAEKLATNREFDNDKPSVDTTHLFPLILLDGVFDLSELAADLLIALNEVDIKVIHSVL